MKRILYACCVAIALPFIVGAVWLFKPERIVDRWAGDIRSRRFDALFLYYAVSALTAWKLG